ncbi:hypothetical protein [Desulforhopalus sp. IMCC35007]|uniref:hypothetical protein n=1 Tax=Desulforhopalus sp. IMCC35007 TaxID=2569543 RepID=UPI0010ADB71E|nr:hypothetical protein [Desulforhopalus sp. IMCC35007]TKB07448.1 hypothetical protein FCL48_17050 [Desulforhopalus sp. IMCC35007]
MDLAAIGSLLGSLKTATEIAKLIRESDATLEKAETKLKLAELVSAIADAKLDAAEVQQLILDRDETIRQLTAAAKLKTEIKWRQPCYYLSNSEGLEEPYCQNCYDSEQKLSRLHSDGKGFFQCRVCRQGYKTAERLKRESDDFNANMKRGRRLF